MQLVEETENHVKEYMSRFQDSSHDWSHVERVRKMALRIAQDENERKPNLVDANLVELAALLHDIGDFKFLAAGETTETALRSFMQSTGYLVETQEAIVWICSRVSFRHELENAGSCIDGPWAAELRCVQDADRLEAIGAIGIARCFAYNGARNLPLYEANVAPLIDLNSHQYNQQATKSKSNARNHFYEKLLKLAGMMKTSLGRKEAARRHALLLEFILEFDRECGLSSPPVETYNKAQ